MKIANPKNSARSLFLVAFLLTGASPPDCGGKTAAKKELTILHTNDIHNHLKPEKSNPFGLGGMGRLSTLIKTRKAESGATITLDAGDWSEGHMYYNLDAGVNILRMMDRMGYDGVALGNHDFLTGPDLTMERVKEAGASFAVLAANIDVSGYARGAELKQVLPPYAVREVDGLKVGIIGLTTYEITYSSYFKPVRITNPAEAVAPLIQELRPKVDVLLVTSHNNFEVNKLIAKSMFGIDAVISGHSHFKGSEAVMVSQAGRDVPVVEAGDHGAFLGELKLEIDPLTKIVRFKSYKLHPVTPDLPVDPVIEALVEEEDHSLHKKYGGNVHAPVAEAAFIMSLDSKRESPIATLAARSYREASNADLALELSSFLGSAIAQGPVSTMDIHNVSPRMWDPRTDRGWTIHLWEVTGSDLLLALNLAYTASYFGWVTMDNVDFVFEPELRSPPAIRSLKIAGQPLDLGRRYKVAIHDGIVRALEIINQQFNVGIDVSRIADTRVETWRAVESYVRRNPRLTQESLGNGRHSRTNRADLAIQDYDLSFDGSSLNVGVQNLGLESATEVRVTCFSGLKGDLVRYGSNWQEWREIGQASMGVMYAQSTAVAKIDWQPAAGGFTPVRCEVKGSFDSFAHNSSAERVFGI